MKNVQIDLLFFLMISIVYVTNFSCVSSKNRADKKWVNASLDNLNDFDNNEGNWVVAKSINIDESSIKEDTKFEEIAKFIRYKKGGGILLNLPSNKYKSNLTTKWTHGDIELELEVKIPRSSNSGIYLQSRYEVQLLDSWGVEEPKFGDIGGIYENWHQEPQKAFHGSAPLVNAAKRPEQWQKVKIIFNAPRFDENGKKIKNAIFKKVFLNGKLVQNDVEVNWPTGGGIDNEVKDAPLLLQGDHGPVAFRRIRYLIK